MARRTLSKAVDELLNRVMDADEIELANVIADMAAIAFSRDEISWEEKRVAEDILTLLKNAEERRYIG